MLCMQQRVMYKMYNVCTTHTVRRLAYDVQCTTYTVRQVMYTEYTSNETSLPCIVRQRTKYVRRTI